MQTTRPDTTGGIAVLATAAYAGVMIAIGLGLGRYWLDLPPQEFAAWFEANFIFLLPTVAVTSVPALAAAVIAARRTDDAAGRRDWYIALGLIGVTFAVTLAYHLPANLRIWDLTMTDDELRTELTRWLALHAVRVVGALAAAWYALRATIAHTAMGSRVTPALRG
ncbi:MAG: DUF1772 domain-containing protein [Actinomycetota bacterium]